MAKINHSTQAKKHLKAAADNSDHIDGHLLVMHHLMSGFVYALLNDRLNALASIEEADAKASEDLFKDALSDPVYVREYELAKARIHAALYRTA